jgi:hypothetical protein
MTVGKVELGKGFLAMPRPGTRSKLRLAFPPYRPLLSPSFSAAIAKGLRP